MLCMMPIFPTTVNALTQLTELSKSSFLLSVEQALSIRPRDFSAIDALDKAYYNIASVSNIYKILSTVHPNELMRNTATSDMIELNALITEKINTNKEVYQCL